MIRNHKIKFFFNNVSISLENRPDLKRKINSIFLSEKKKYSIVSFIFCNDQYLLSINNKFLGHDTYTDIITFPLNEVGEAISGEIYISVDRVRENAANGGCTIKKELHRVLFHGVLHLCGYKDKTKKDKKTMTAKENFPEGNPYLKNDVPRGTPGLTKKRHIFTIFTINALVADFSNKTQRGIFAF